MKHLLYTALAIACTLLLASPAQTAESRLGTGPFLIQATDGTDPTCFASSATGDLCVGTSVRADVSVIAPTGTFSGTVTAGAVTASVLSTPELKVAEVAITLAEMIGLVGANKVLIAAQGANTVIVPERVVFFLDYGSAVFTESDDNLALNYVDKDGDPVCTQFEVTGSWLVQAADAYGVYHCDTNILATVAQAVNTALTLDNNGNGEYGDGTGSTVTLWIYYRVLDVS